MVDDGYSSKVRKEAVRRFLTTKIEPGQLKFKCNVFMFHKGSSLNMCSQRVATWSCDRVGY